MAARIKRGTLYAQISHHSEYGWFWAVYEKKFFGREAIKSGYCAIQSLARNTARDELAAAKERNPSGTETIL